MKRELTSEDVQGKRETNLLSSLALKITIGSSKRETVNNVSITLHESWEA